MAKTYFFLLTYKSERIPPDGRYPYTLAYSVLFLLKQLIREYGSIDEISGIDFQRIGYIKENLQRETVGKAGRFDCADQRTAHSGLFRQLLLRKTTQLPQGCDSYSQLDKSVTVLERYLFAHIGPPHIRFYIIILFDDLFRRIRQ